LSIPTQEYDVSRLPRISVVTPSFNQGEFVEATLLSIISQGYPDLEYVVIDGGSTDGSDEIIRRYSGDLAFWVSEPDRGHAHAVNKGFAHTSGEIMCWLNSSDMYYPWTFATVAEIFSELPEVQWIQGLPTQFSASGGPKAVTAHVFNIYDILAGDYRWIQQESVFWRRQLWDRAGGHLDESLNYSADFDLWLRFLRSARLHHVDTVLGGFRVHGNRLGAPESYRREAESVFRRWSTEHDRTTTLRAQMVRAAALRHGQSRLIGNILFKLGVWPWYQHPSVTFDFSEAKWAVR
jgi:glycosyltransferase involved in cell wall biosynthesis